MIHEFEKLTGFHPTTDLYKAIEHAYMDFDGDKVEFCKAYVENRDNLASRIARAVDEADREIQLQVNSTIRELEKQNAELAKKLEAEQEWKLREDTDNVAQADYEKLAGAGGTEELAELLSGACPPFTSECDPVHCHTTNCRDCWLAWLTTGKPANNE